MKKQILHSLSEKLRAVLVETEAAIALTAKHSSYFACFVAMVKMKAAQRFSVATDSAGSVLSLKHSLVLLNRYSVRAEQVHASSGSLPFLAHSVLALNLAAVRFYIRGLRVRLTDLNPMPVTGLSRRSASGNGFNIFRVISVPAGLAFCAVSARPVTAAVKLSNRLNGLALGTVFSFG